jgi:hypothetical protein
MKEGEVWAKMERKEKVKGGYLILFQVIIQGGIPKIPYLKAKQGVAQGFVEMTDAHFPERCAIPLEAVKRLNRISAQRRHQDTFPLFISPQERFKYRSLNDGLSVENR